MRVRPPDVSDVDVAHCVALGWGVRVLEIAYAPVGFGSHHWHVTTDAGHLFATVDVHRDGRYPLVVHSWLEGTVLSELDDDRTAETIGILARLHDAPTTTAPARRAELTVQGRRGFDSAMRTLGSLWPGPYGERARALLRENRDQLVALFAIHDREAAEMLENQHDWVVTHGEPHDDNLVACEDGLHLIDWDSVLIAPAARDVWQVGGERGLEHYRELTGRPVPRAEIEHFRRDWDLAEICQYTPDFAAPHQETADTAIMWEGYTESLGLLLA